MHSTRVIHFVHTNFRTEYFVIIDTIMRLNNKHNSSSSVLPSDRWRQQRHGRDGHGREAEEFDETTSFDCEQDDHQRSHGGSGCRRSNRCCCRRQFEEGRAAGNSNYSRPIYTRSTVDVERFEATAFHRLHAPGHTTILRHQCGVYLLSLYLLLLFFLFVKSKWIP